MGQETGAGPVSLPETWSGDGVLALWLYTSQNVLCD